MRTLIRPVRYESKLDTFRFYPLPDVHLGNKDCDERALAAWVKRVADDPLALWCGMGDYAEFINRKDKRFDEEALASWLWGVGDLAKAQRERAIETLLPIAAKCVGMVKGNHEDTIYTHTERDVYGPLVEAISQAAGGAALTLDYSGFVRLAFQYHPAQAKGSSWVCDIFVTHGWWAGRFQGNGALQLEHLSGWVDAQVVLAGHDHKLKTLAQTVVKPCKNGQVEHVRQVCGSVGAFLDGAKYAEAKGYRPTPPGYLTVTIEPNKHEIRITQ